MLYPSYLIHFNKNHSSSNGQFISGDGDGDGIINDNKNQKRKKKTIKKASGADYDGDVFHTISGKMQRDSAIFCASYKKYGLSKTLDLIDDFNTIDNFIDSLSR